MTGAPLGPDASSKGVLTSLLTAIIVVLLVIGVAAVAVLRPTQDDPIVGTVGAAPATNGPSPSVCPGPAIATSGALLSQLLIQPPDGFVQQSDQAVRGGVLSVPQIAADSQQPGQATAELRADGFQGAVLRVWIDAASQEQIQVTLVEFSCADGASEYFNTQLTGDYGVTSADPFVIDGLGSARGERSTTPDAKGHYLQVVGLISGSIYAQTSTFTPGPDDGSLAGAVSDLQAGALAPV